MHARKSVRCDPKSKRMQDKAGHADAETLARKVYFPGARENAEGTSSVSLRMTHKCQIRANVAMKPTAPKENALFTS